MKIPNYQRLSEEDFDQEDLSPLAEQINRPLASLTQALQGRLTFGENMAGSVQELILDGNFPKLIQNPLRTAPTGILPLSTSTPSAITASPFILFETSGSQIKITNVLGVTASSASKAKIKVLIL